MTSGSHAIAPPRPFTQHIGGGGFVVPPLHPTNIRQALSESDQNKVGLRISNTSGFEGSSTLVDPFFGYAIICKSRT